MIELFAQPVARLRHGLGPPLLRPFPKLASLELSEGDQERAFREYLAEDDAEGDDRWLAEVESLARRYARHRRRGRPARTQEAVRQQYERIYSELALDEASGAEPTALVWGRKAVLARADGIKRVHLLWLHHVLGQLRPRRVLEVGCGRGRNLLLLAGALPEVEWSGIELSEAGVAAARAVQALPALPERMARFAPFPLRDPQAYRCVRFQQGSAESLPFADGEFDVVVTVLALEQMRSIVDRALREIARVGSGHVLLIEPFSDWNRRGLRRDFVEAEGYFDLRVRDLARYGIEVVHVCGTLPTKVRLGCGAVVGRLPPRDGSAAREA